MTHTTKSVKDHLSRRASLAFATLLACIAGLLFAGAPAFAEFTRPYITQITGTPTGVLGEVVPFSRPGGLAVDPSNSDVYVEDDGSLEALDEFSSSDAFVAQSPGLSIESLPFGKNVDSSTNPLDPGRGDVYEAGDRVTGRGGPYNEVNTVGFVSRVNAEHKPVPFTCLEHGSRPDYINENGELTGDSSESWTKEPEHGVTEGTVTDVIAVDFGAGEAAGDFYVVDKSNILHETGSLIDQFTPEGCFVQTFTGAGIPGGDFATQSGHPVSDVVVDPTTGDLLVEDGTTEVIYEFTSKDEYLGEITGTSPSAPFIEHEALNARGFAVSPAGDLYVNACPGGRLVGPPYVTCAQYVVYEFGQGAFYPTAVTGGVSANSSTFATATLNGVVNDEDRLLTGCQFEYVSEGLFKANDVNEIQTVSVEGATGGTYSLAFDGQSTGATGKGDLVGPAGGEGDVIAGSNTITGLTTMSGSFVAGESISGADIPADTTILSVKPSSIVMSAEATGEGRVTVSAVSDVVTGLKTASGAFAVGEEISGAGIPEHTTVVEVGVGTGTLTLSAGVTVGGSEVALSAAIPFDASAAQVRAALESLPSIGAGNVGVTGVVGGPYKVEFTGSLAHERLPVLTAGALTLVGLEAKVVPVVLVEGGDGWGGAASAECEEPSAAQLKPGLENHAVHGDLTGLKAGEVYDYRLVATTNPAEHGGTQDGAVESFAAAGAPVVGGVSVGGVSASFADFHAEINPVGVDTTYEFEYVDAVGYAAAVTEHAPDPYTGGGSVPVPAGDVGSGDRGVSVSVPVGGLSPGTEYHYRVLARNGAGVADGVDGVFVTVPAGLQGLPDGRSYELLTPPNKGDAEDMFGIPQLGSVGEQNDDYGFASEDGDHFLLQTRAAFGPFPVSGLGVYVFSRGGSGWSFKSLASPGLAIQTLDGLVFDPADLSTVGVVDAAGAGSTDEHRVFDLDGSPGGPYATVVSGGSDSPDELASEVGASTNLSRVVVQSYVHKLPVCDSSQQALAETLDTHGAGLYEWRTGRECLSLLDLNSEGDELISKCGAVLGRGQSQYFSGDTHGAVSGDGSKVFFTAPAPVDEAASAISVGPGCWNGGRVNPPELYMRVNGETTLEISAPEAGLESEPIMYPAIYVGASADGSKVFFMTRTELTSEAVALKTHEPELYEYDTDSPEGQRLVRISRGDLGSGPVEGKVLDVPAISGDGSSVYFNAEGDLTPEAHGGGLYRYDTDTGQTAYVAKVQEYPKPESDVNQPTAQKPRSTWYENELNGKVLASLDPEALYYTTGNGRFLLFGAYRYDAADGSTVCVMCNPDGSGPIPDASFTRSAFQGNDPAGGSPRPISENGEYVFFDTAESLVPQDTNGVLDVYEWEAQGAGGCGLAQGCVHLVSSGQDPKSSYFLDSSSCTNAKGETVEGCNVFFGTHAKLVSADTDGSGDLYDARIGGGFESGTGSGPCEGDACDNPPAAPLAQTPATLTLASSGNITTEIPGAGGSKTKAVTKTVKCHRGFVRKKVKKKEQCVQKPKAKKAKKSAHANRRAK
jgi:hypothetical protein